jgi:hypothetical protein
MTILLAQEFGCQTQTFQRVTHGFVACYLSSHATGSYDDDKNDSDDNRCQSCFTFICYS